MGNEHGELAVELNTLPISTRRALAELIQWLLDVAARWAL